MKRYYPLRKFGRWVSELPVGGSWGTTLSETLQKNLRWFWFDGLFASACDNIIVNFISVYILVLGATGTQIGLMSTFTNIASALILLPGAFLAERFAKRKGIALSSYFTARLAILMLIFVPILFKGQTAVWIAIIFSVTRDFFNNMAYPSWMSVTNDTVPIEGRGRYLGSRNFIMNITGMLSILLAGKLITVFVGNKGYQVALGLAFVFSMLSIFCYSRIKEESPTPGNPLAIQNVSLRSIFRLLKSQPQFVSLLIVTAVWNFSLNIAGPFFTVQMVNGLHFTATSIGFLAVVTSLTTILTQNQIGSLTDRIGPRKLQLISMFLIPLLPLTWLFCTKVWQIAINNAFSGVFWGCYNLVSFALLLMYIPKDAVPRFSAIFQIVVLLSLAAGSFVGSMIIDVWNFYGVCIVSGIGRFVAAFMFAKMVHEPSITQVEPATQAIS
jgi:MFS family permease